MERVKKAFAPVASIWKRIVGMKYSFLFLSFGIPLLIMLLINVAMSVYPFGKSSVLVLDLNAQYVYFYEKLKLLITEGGSFFYSWQRSLGGEFIGMFAYYIASPFALLPVLFKEGSITEALLIIELLKCALCGLTMSLYLYKTAKSRPVNVIIFSTMYALCSYITVYGNNIMWLDALIYLPLIIYGIEQLIYKKRYLLYVITLTLAVLANFYIGFMLCIFSVIYFFIFYFMHIKNGENNFYFEKLHFIKSTLRFALFTGLAVLMTVIILYPTYYSLTFGKTEFTDPSFGISSKFPLLDMVVKFFPDSFDTVTPDGLPNVYCGLLSLIMLPAFFLCKKIKPREKVGYGALLLMFVLSCNLSIVNLIWHGLQNPQWLNYRFTFMLVFIIIVIGYRAFINLSDIKYSKIIGIGAFILLLLLVIEKFGYDFLGKTTFAWVSLGFLAVYIVGLFYTKNKIFGHAMKIILLLAVSFEMLVSGILDTNGLDTDVTISTRGSYTDFFDRVSPIVKSVQAQDGSFYRMEKSVIRATNDNMKLSMRGITSSTSTLNASVIDLLKELGYSSSGHISQFIGDNPVSNSLLGIKYIVGEDSYFAPAYEEYIKDEEHTLTAYKNPNALSLAYAVNGATASVDIDGYDTPFKTLNALITSMLGEEETVEVFKPVDSSLMKIETENFKVSKGETHTGYKIQNIDKDATVTITLNANTNEEIFMYIPTDYPINNMWLYLDGTNLGSYCGWMSTCVRSLGGGNDGKAMNIFMSAIVDNEPEDKDDLFYFKNLEDGDSYFYYLDTALYNDVMQKLAGGNLNITEFTDTYLRGTVNVPEGQNILFTTIPYDENWHIYIDGEEANIHKTLDSLLAVKISDGQHNVEIKYIPRQFRIGAAVSCGALFIFATIAVADTVIKRKRKKAMLSKKLF